MLTFDNAAHQHGTAFQTRGTGRVRAAAFGLVPAGASRRAIVGLRVVAGSALHHDSPTGLAFTAAHSPRASSSSSAPPPSSDGTVATTTNTKKKPSFAVSLPTSSISVNAYQEEWEYDLEDDEFEDDLLDGRRGAKTRDGGRGKGVGVIEKKANTTVVGGEVVIGRDGRGDVKVIFSVKSCFRRRADEDSISST